MSLSFPNPEAVRDHIAQLPADEFRVVSIMAELLVFQANTIDAMADFLITEARKFELTNKTITFEELKAAGKKLHEYAERLAPSAPGVQR